MNLVAAFEALIHEDYRLERAGGNWVVEELNRQTSNSKIQIAAGASFAFTLDRSGKNPLPFIRENTPLHGMRSACDAIVVCQNATAPVILLLEMKSKQQGQADQQILRSRKFVEWLLGLLALNDHCREEPRFIAVISQATRQQERKGTTRRAELPTPRTLKDMPCWTVTNRRTLHIVDFLKADA